MKYFLLAGSFLLSGAHLAAAQTVPAAAPAAAGPPCAALSGYVLGNNKPLAGATVSIQGTRLLTITNSEGYYTLPAANVPKPTLQFSAAGYEAQSISPTTCADEHVEMLLLPTAPAPAWLASLPLHTALRLHWRRPGHAPLALLATTEELTRAGQPPARALLLDADPDELGPGTELALAEILSADLY